MRVIIKPAGLAVVLSAIIALASAAFFKKRTPEAVDAVSVSTAVPKPKPTALELAQNPGMEETDTGRLPTGWKQTWVGHGNVDIRLDENEGHGSPPSLLLDTLGAKGQAQIAQLIRVKPGDKLNVKAFVKSQGVGTFSFAIQLYDKNTVPVHFKHAGFANPGDEWRSVGTSVVVPDKVVSLGVVLFASGTGRAWMDDVSVKMAP